MVLESDFGSPWPRWWNSDLRALVGIVWRMIELPSRDGISVSETSAPCHRRMAFAFEVIWRVLEWIIDGWLMECMFFDPRIIAGWCYVWWNVRFAPHIIEGWCLDWIRYFAQSSFRTIRNAVPHTSSMDDAGVKCRMGWSTWLVDHLLGFGWTPLFGFLPRWWHVWSQ